MDKVETKRDTCATSAALARLVEEVKSAEVRPAANAYNRTCNRQNR